MSESEQENAGKVIVHKVDVNQIDSKELEKLKELNAIRFSDSPVKTPLDAAAAFLTMKNYPTAERTKELLKYNPPLNQVEDKKGASPLTYAVMFADDVEVVWLLLDAGADISKKTKNGWDIFELGVAKSQQPEIISYILTRFPKNKEGLSQLLLKAVANNSNVDVIKVLLDMGADVNYMNEQGVHSLRAVMNNPSLEVIQLLLDAGAEINASDHSGITPLMDAAATCKDPRVFEMLLNAGADPKMSDNNGYTAFLHAVMFNDSEEVMDILDSVYHDHKQLDIALYLVTRYTTKSSVVGKLMDMGASLEYKDKDGKSAYDWAQKNSNPVIREQFDEFVVIHPKKHSI